MLLARAYWLGHLAEVAVQGVDRIGRVRLYGTETSDRARDLVFLRVRSTCCASAATVGDRDCPERDTCLSTLSGENDTM
jgi:hypothetical protein